MDLDTAITLFFSMAILAAIPSTSVFIVSARAAAYGFLHGATTALGIVAGDIIFILIAIFGLALLAETLGDLFIIVKILGALYLSWLGIMLWRTKTVQTTNNGLSDTSLTSSFLSGLLLTLADQKAIFFYLGFFPAFINLATLSMTDASIIILITVLAVGGVKLFYAYIASRMTIIKTTQFGNIINRFASLVMLSVAAFLLIAIFNE